MPNGVCLLLAAVSLEEIIHCLLHNFEDQRVVVGSSNAGTTGLSAHLMDVPSATSISVQICLPLLSSKSS